MNDKISSIGINANHKCYTTLESISLLIAGIGHDLSHPGNNNMYEINTQSILACFYNNRSVLENYHSYILFSFNYIIIQTLRVFLSFFIYIPFIIIFIHYIFYTNIK